MSRMRGELHSSTKLLVGPTFLHIDDGVDWIEIVVPNGEVESTIPCLGVENVVH